MLEWRNDEKTLYVTIGRFKTVKQQSVMSVLCDRKTNHKEKHLKMENIS